MEYKRVVSIFLINPKKKILLQLRDNNPKITFPNYWTPFGGHADDEETTLEAAKREIKEETGLDIENVLFLDKKVISEYNEEVFFFKANINKDIKDMTITEGQKGEFFSAEKLICLNIPEFIKEVFIKNKEKILD